MIQRSDGNLKFPSFLLNAHGFIYPVDICFHKYRSNYKTIGFLDISFPLEAKKLPNNTKLLKFMKKLNIMTLEGGTNLKLSIFIDKNREEEIIIFTHQKNALIEQIEEIVSDIHTEITAFKDKEIIKLKITDVFCFTVENGKLYAITKNDKLLLKCRLYSIETAMPNNFIKINKSCIANIEKIDRFDASVSGTLMVKFKNGYIDYVSRRNIKAVKERLGL